MSEREDILRKDEVQHDGIRLLKNMITTTDLPDHTKKSVSWHSQEIQNSSPLKPIHQINKITLFNNLIRNGLKINLISSYLTFEEHFREIANIFSENAVWSKQVILNSQKCLAQYKTMYEQYEKGEEPMTSYYLEEIKSELLNLKELPEFPLEIPDDNVTAANQIMESIQEVVKKGNRVNFKLIQELQAKFEELIEHQPEKNEVQEEMIKENNKKINSLVHLVLETFDQLDLIYTHTKNIKDKEWGEQSGLAVQKALRMLEEFGIEEIPVLGNFFDGNLMEAIGTIPKQEIHSDIDTYHVFAVHQRGFRYRDNSQLIRRARVTTVL
jgi:molecular chaperone GrpE (heat shock protein)